MAVVEVEPHAARDRLRIGEHLADRVDRACRNAGRLELRQQRVTIECSQRLDDQLAQLRAVGDAGGIGGEIRVGGQVGETDHRAELAELAIIADR